MLIVSRWILSVVLILLFLFAPTEGLATAKSTFPAADCIEPNVKFWTDIYSKYPSSQGLVHDNRDLSVIYEALKLEDTWLPKARKRNRKKIKQVKKKYQKILSRLAKGVPAKTPQEHRVVALFGPLATAKTYLEAKENIRFQLGQRDIFRQGIIRSGAYLAEIKKILRSYGVPQDLAYLPHVESSFNYKAYSKFGASGIWQFTRSTGKRFLNVGYALDERRDPILAAHAAAKLLKYNYEKLGNWPMAITAYNHGLNGMLRAKNQKGTYSKIFQEYNGSLFRFASRNFYSEFLAARKVAKNHSKYFGYLHLDPPIRTRKIKLSGYAPIDDLVDYLKMNMAEFREMNPAIREPVYSGQKYIPKGYAVRLPENSAVLSLAAKIPGSLYKSKQKRSSFYLVRRGDTASGIARRHKIKLKDLILANQLNRRATIYIGQNLRIPKPGERVVRLASVSKKKVKTPQPIPAPVIADKKHPPAPQPLVVAKGPQVVKQDVPAEVEQPQAPPLRLALAKVHGPLPSLKLNEGESEVVDENQDRIPLVSTHRLGESPAREEGSDAVAQINQAVVMGHLSVEKIIKKKGKLFGVIRVEAEETLGHYADWLGVRAWDIRRINNYRYGRAIHVDQSLTIPLAKVGKDRFEELRYEYHKEMEEDFFAAYRVEGLRHYTIKQGDNIWSLCRNELDLPFWLIKKYNSELDFGNLKPKQRLLVPVVETLS